MSSLVKHILSGFASIVCLGMIGILLTCMIYEVHPEQSTVESKAISTMVLSDQISNQTTNLQINVLNNYMSENSIIKKIYKIEK